MSENNSTDLSIVKNEVVHLRKDVNKILDILMEHPTHALNPRIIVLENDVDQIQALYKEHKDQNWQLKVALYSSIFAFVSSISLMVMELILKAK